MADAEVDLVTLIANAGGPELELVNKRITTLEAEIRRFVDSRKAEIASLKLVRRVLNRKLQPPPSRAKKPRNANGTELQRQIYDLLSQEGSMPVPAIAGRLKKTAQGIAACVGMCDWFLRQNGEVSIAVKV